MRILLVSNLYPPYCLGGYERLAGWIASGLEERGHVVHVLTGRGSDLSGPPNLHPTLDLDLPGLLEAHHGAGIAFDGGFATAAARHVFSVPNFRACRAAIAAAKPDLLSFWNPAFITFSPLLAARWEGVPSVVHFSDTVVNPFRNPHPPSFPPVWRSGASRAVDGLLRLSNPRRLVVPSHFLGDKLKRDERLSGDRLTVLPWPVPPPVGRAQSPPDRVRATRLLFVGSLAPEKGTSVLLEAFRRAWGEQPDLTLTLVGDASREDVRRLQAAATHLPVRFLGQLEHPRVVEEYAGHDVLLFPSIWDEPFALVPLEAMAMGLAVVATRAGGTPEAISDGQTGLLVPPGDAAALAGAILRLARDPALFRSIAGAGRERTRREHDFPSFIVRLEALYAESSSPRGAW